MKSLIRPQILVVEDEAIVARDIGDRLQSMGYSVPCISMTGQEALEKAEETHPDLILMDINLKGQMDGIAAAAEIRHRFQVPIIYLTAYSDEETLERAKATEPSAYLLKPFVEGELQSAIEIALYKDRHDRKISRGERYQVAAALGLLDHAAIITDELGVVKYVNKAAERMLNTHQSEALDKPVDDLFRLINVEDGKAINHFIDDVLREELTLKLDHGVILRSLGGQDLPVDFTASPMLDERGNPLGTILMIKDVSASFKREQELRASENRKAAILETMPDCILVLDHDGRVIDANTAAEKKLGFSRESMLGRLAVEMVVGFGWRDWFCFELANLSTQPEGVNIEQTVELNAIGHEGKEFPAEATLRRLRTAGLPVFTLHLRDVSRHRNFENELNKLVNRLQSAIHNTNGKNLAGLLPICSCCKKIRDEKGSWHQLEAYFSSRSYLTFSHAYCPDCLVQVRKSFGLQT